jgi:hypothetical protein
MMAFLEIKVKVIQFFKKKIDFYSHLWSFISLMKKKKLRVKFYFPKKGYVYCIFPVKRGFNFCNGRAPEQKLNNSVFLISWGVYEA